MSDKKRVKLKKQKNIKRVALTVPEVMDEEDKYSKLPEYCCAAMKTYFKGYERIAAVMSAYSTRMGDRIEIYDLGSDIVIGAIYPDGASMLWPYSWWEGRSSKALIKVDEFDITYSDLLNKANKPKVNRVVLKQSELPRRVKLQNKTKRVSLNV